MIVVTGATGRMGRQVVEGLLRTVPADQITAAVRNPAKAADLAVRGVHVRTADYEDPGSLRTAFEGADRLLLISSNDFPHAVQQHTAAVAAAEQAKVGLLVYTSLVHADTVTLRTAVPHRLTEPVIRNSGLPFTLLRNNMYTDVFAPQFQQAAASGSLPSSFTGGRLATATRADYASAAVAVLTGDGHAGNVYELGGDTAWSFPELAAALSHAAGRDVTCEPVTAAEHRDLLIDGGVPPLLADLYVDILRAAADGELAGTPGDLHRLLGRPPTPLTQTVADILAG